MIFGVSPLDLKQVEQNHKTSPYFKGRISVYAPLNLYSLKEEKGFL